MVNEYTNTRAGNGPLKEDKMTYSEEIRAAAKSGIKGAELRKRAEEICKRHGAHSVANVMLAIDITRHPDNFDILIGGLPQVNAPGL